MTDSPGTPAAGGERRTVRIRYDELTAKYASQFVVNRADDDILIGFSSGAVEDGAAGEMLLPVHSRIAMSRKSVERLLDVLASAISCDAEGGDG